MAPEIQHTSLVKQLAANDRPTRDAAILSLKTYLSGARTLVPIELLKLWKGLFYCMWMSDRPRPQQALANDLASFVATVPPTITIPFLRAFWQTMAREWTNIDVLRMEKFLLLTRRYVGATFSLLEKAGWEEKVVETHLDMLEEIPLNVADGKLPNGMRYHVIDVFVDELERVGALEMEGTGANLDTLLRPLRRLGKESPTKTVRTRCKEALEDERLPTNKKTLQDAVTDEEWNGFED